MKYTNTTLHGLIYYHTGDGPTNLRRIILCDVHSPRGYTHTDCKVSDGITTAAWFTLEQANRWIEEKIWILIDNPNQINNTYSLY